MKRLNTLFVLSLLTFSLTSEAARLKINCTYFDGASYDITLEEGAPLTPAQVRSLPPKTRSYVEAWDNQAEYKITMTKRGEKPRVIRAVGGKFKDRMQAFSYDAIVSFSSSIGPEIYWENSSGLAIGFDYMPLSCKQEGI